MAAVAPAREFRDPSSVVPAWLYPRFMAAALSLFALDSAWVVFINRSGSFDPYLSPYFSPRILPNGPQPPAIWVAWAPFAFRLTCYCRKANFRGFFSHPWSCALEEPPRSGYHPWVIQPSRSRSGSRTALRALVSRLIGAEEF